MKKILSLMFALMLVLAWCGAQGTTSTDKKGEFANPEHTKDEPQVVEKEQTPVSFKVIAPAGMPALSMVRLFVDKPEIKNATISYETVDSADVLAASLIKHEADVAIVPTNLAATLYAKGAGYKVAGSSVWGILYIASTEDIKSLEDLKGKTISLWGKGLTPDAMLRFVLTENGIDPEKDVKLEYFSTVEELATNYLAGKSTVSMIPQPVLTNVLMKSEKSKVAINLQDEWKKITKLDKYPQTSLIISDKLAASNPVVVRDFLYAYDDAVDWVNQNPAEAGKYYESLGIGLKAPIIEKAIPQSNLDFVFVNDDKDSINKYLEVLYKFNPKLTGEKEIDDGLYSKI